MAQADYYHLLGVTRTATQDEIKKSFKKLARQYHPDLNPGDKAAEKKFKEMSEAYDVLSDPEKRKKYDQFGSGFANFAGGGAGAPGGGFYGGPFQGGGFQQGNIDFEDLFSDLFATAGGPARNRRGGGRRTAGRPGSDVEATIELDFVEAALGGEKRLSLGPNKTFTVRVPPGAKTGSRLKISGKGQEGTGGYPPGDLYVNVIVREHPYFKREGNDILLETSVGLGEVLSGARITVPTLTGTVEVKIPKGASSGIKLRLKGKGIVDSKTKHPGDQYVILKIELPPDLKDEDAEKVAEIISQYPPVRRSWD